MNDPRTPPVSRSGRAFRWILGGMAGLFGLFILAALVGKPAKRQADTARGDVSFMHALILPVRKANEPDFTDETLEVRVEIFRDEATGNAVYVSRPNPSRKGSTISAAASR